MHQVTQNEWLEVVDNIQILNPNFDHDLIT